MNNILLENKMEVMQHILKCSKSPCCLYIYNEFVGLFANAGLQKVNIFLHCVYAVSVMIFQIKICSS
jgi:hypothetical protein